LRSVEAGIIFPEMLEVPKKPITESRWRRRAGNFYVQLTAAYGVVAVVSYLRAFPFRSHYGGQIWLTPLHAYWDPRITPWAAAAAVALAGAVLLAIWGARKQRLWPPIISAAIGIVAVNAAPGGGRKFPLDWLERALFDARILFGAPNVFADYVEITKTVSCHCRVRPGGLYWFLGICDRLFNGNVFLVSGSIIIVAAVSVPLLYLAARALVGRETSITAAALLACAPSFLIFGSGPDGLYCFLAAAIIALGIRATTGRWVWALGAGFVLAVALTSSFTLAVLAVFLTGLAFAAGTSGRGWKRAAGGWVLIVITALAALAVFQLVTGYEHLAAFERSYRAAQDLPSGGDNVFKLIGRALGLGGANLAKPDDRPYGFFVFGNLYSFFFMMGVPAAVLCCREIVRIIRDRNVRGSLYGAATLGSAAVFLLYDLSGLTLGEVERVWLFLVPLFLIPAAVQLRRIARGPYGTEVLAVSLILCAAQALAYNVLMLTAF
jgi:hypothetical protein